MSHLQLGIQWGSISVPEKDGRAPYPDWMPIVQVQLHIFSEPWQGPTGRSPKAHPAQAGWCPFTGCVGRRKPIQSTAMSPASWGQRIQPGQQKLAQANRH